MNKLLTVFTVTEAMANAVDTEEVHVGNGDDVQVKQDNSTQPAYIVEIEVNAEGQVVGQTTRSNQNTDPVPVAEVTMHYENELEAINSMHNYFQQSANGNHGPETNSTLTTSSASETVVEEMTVDDKLLENITRVVNSNVSVVHDSGQVIVVLGQDCQLSDSDIEAIRLQVSKSEQIDTIKEPENLPIPEPSNFTEQVPEESKCSPQKEDKGDVRVCYQCKGEFESADALVLHFVQEHSTSVKCQYCEKVFPSIAEANQHKKQRHVEIKCLICGKTYYGTQSLNHHFKLRHSKGTKCGTCYKYFDSKKEMEDHIEEVHKFHKCNFCGKGFYFQTSLANHVESEHGQSTLDAEIGGTETMLHKENPPSSQVLQTNHLQSVATNIAPVHSSNITESPNITHEEPEMSTFDTSSAVDTPTPVQASRKSPRKPALKCSFCGEGFYLRSSLTNHMHNKHKNQSTVDTDTIKDLIGRTNNCTDTELPETNKTPEAVCNDHTATDEQTTSSKRAKLHENAIVNQAPAEQTVNGTEVPQPQLPLRKSPRKRASVEGSSTKKLKQDASGYVCKLCDTSFIKSPQCEYLYSKHMAEIHLQFQCEKCGADLKNYRSFMTHMKSKHQMSTDVFVCAYCQQEFRTQRTFDLHSRDNWKRCPVAVGCTYCTEVFVSTKTLTVHHKKEHKGKPMHYKV